MSSFRKGRMPSTDGSVGKGKASANDETSVEASVGNRLDRLEERFESLESTLIMQMRAMQRDIVYAVKEQQRPSDTESPPARNSSADHDNADKGSASSPLSVYADYDNANKGGESAIADHQKRLEGAMRKAFRSFAKVDGEHNAFLNSEALKAALNSLGSLPGGTEVQDHDTEDIIGEYDIDGNGVLDSEEFRPVVRDLVLRRRFDFREELQKDVEAIAMATKEDPWAMAMRGDTAVKSMIEHVRAQHVSTHGSSSVKEQGAWERSSRTSAGSNTADAANMRRSRSIDSLLLGGRYTPLYCWSLLPVLHPEGRLRSVWNVLVALLIIYCGVVVPLEIAFEPAMEAGMGVAGWLAWENWNLVVDIFFLLDILLNFRTGFIADGVFLRDTRLICRHYLSGSFLIDLLGSFPLNLILKAIGDDGDGTARLNRQLRLLRIVKLNRLLRLFKLSKSLKYVELMVKFNPSAMRIVKLLLIMVTLTLCRS